MGFNKTNIAELRGVPLGLVMERMGAEPDPADPKRNWLHPAGRITVTGEKFHNHTVGTGGGGAIDLAMHLGDYSFKEAIAWLAKEAGRPRVIEEYNARAEATVNKIINETPVPSEIPRAVVSKNSQVRDYLHDVRKIPMEKIAEAFNTGNLWADSFGNCVFPMRNDEGTIVAAEIRGTYDRPFHGTRGDKYWSFFYTGSPASKEAAFTESAIDALSYETLHPETLVISTNGSRREAVVKLAKKLADKGFNISLALDNDKAGINLADRILSDLAPELGSKIRLALPTAKDWNQELQARAEAPELQKNRHSSQAQRDGAQAPTCTSGYQTPGSSPHPSQLERNGAQANLTSGLSDLPGSHSLSFSTDGKIKTKENPDISR